MNGLKNFITLGKAEGISSVLLFFVAMPLKYLFDFPLAVKYVGWIHGLLFISYVVFMLMLAFERKWKWTVALLLFVLAIMPGGPLFFEKRVLASVQEN